MMNVWAKIKLFLNKQEKEAAPNGNIPEDFIAEKKTKWPILEVKIGSFLLPILGLAIFLIGIGYLLKFVIEQHLLNPSLILGMLITTASLLLFLGEYFRNQYPRLIVGSTISSLILFYSAWYLGITTTTLLSEWWVFILEILTMVTGLFLSIRYQSNLIGLFALFGGFLMPLIVHPVLVRPLYLISYLSLLGFIASLFSAIKNWVSYSYVSLFFLIWYYHRFIFSMSGLYQVIFILNIWLLYTIIPYLSSFFIQSKIQIRNVLLIILSSLFTIFALYLLLCHKKSYITILKSLSDQSILNYLLIFFAGIYFGLFGILYFYARHSRSLIYKLSLLFNTLQFLASGSTIYSILISFSGYYQNAMLSFFAVLLLALSFMVNLRLMRVIPYIIWIYVGYHLATLLLYRWPALITLNEINISIGIIVISLLSAIWLSRRYKMYLTGYEMRASGLLEIGLIFVIIYWLHTKVWQSPYHILGLAFFSLLVFLIGIYDQRKIIRQCAYMVFGLSLFYFGLVYFFHNLVNPYWIIRLNILFLVFTIISFTYCYAVRKWFSVFGAKEYQIITIASDVGAAFFIFSWIRALIIINFDELSMHSSFFAKRLMGYSMKNDKLVRTEFTNILLIIYYIFYSIALIFIGLWQKSSQIRILGLTIIGFTVIRLLYMIMQSTHLIYKIIAFLVVGGLLIFASYLYNKIKKD
ncbi:MAG: DUF2339 domain-containing protein [Candidatus Babeliales bacterium]